MAEVPVLDLRGVRKAFNVGTPLEVEVLHGIDLQLRRREFCAVMGPSGSGKSTLLHLAGLLDRPTAGTLCICGQETRGLEEAALTRLRGQSLGFVFQYHHLLGAFTALENVMLPMLARFGRFQSWMAERAARLLDSVGLTPWAHHLASRLSGGQQQRVAVARALALEPVLLLADEPTGNLDTHSAELVFDLLRRVSQEQGTAVLFVTHNPDLAARCDRKIEVVDGRVRERDWAFPGRRGASHP